MGSISGNKVQSFETETIGSDLSNIKVQEDKGESVTFEKTASNSLSLESNSIENKEKSEILYYQHTNLIENQSRKNTLIEKKLIGKDCKDKIISINLEKEVEIKIDENNDISNISVLTENEKFETNKKYLI